MPPGTALASAQARRRTSVWARFRRHRVALVGLVILATLAIGAIGAPVIARQDPNRLTISAVRSTL